MLFDFAAAVADEIHVVRPPMVSERPLPRNFDERDLHLFEHVFRKEIAPAEIFDIRRATAYWDGWLYRNSTLLKDAFVRTRHPSTRRRIKNLPKRLALRLLAPTVPEAVWITDNWSLNYYHWLTEAIPRLFLASQRNPDIRLILPHAHKKMGYTQQTLAPFLTEAPIYVEPNRAVTIDKLLFPASPYYSSGCHDGLIAEVGSIFRQYYGSRSAPSRRVYISRAKASVRQVHNEAQIAPILYSRGFEIVHCEGMSFQEQVKLLSECEILAGPHGAGLVNMMFMPPGSKILEIYPRKPDMVGCYFGLAAAFSHVYYYMLADTLEKGPDVAYPDTMTVDPELLQKNLDLVCRPVKQPSFV